MLRTIMGHELRNLAADRTLWVVAAVFAGIVGYALHNGVSWVNFQNQTLREISLQEETRLADLRGLLASIEAGQTGGGGSPNPAIPGAVAGAGIRYAMLPPAPLAAFSVGQSDLYPYYLRISTREDARSSIRNGELENPTNLMSGRFDLAFAVVYLFPLFILALAYGLLSGEREGGTLAMVMSHPVRLRTVVVGKIFLRALLVTGLALSLALIGSLAFGSITGPGALPRFALWAAVVAAYTLFWFAAALAVGALGRGSAWNATALLGIWLVLVVIAPASVHLAATILHPLPSRVEMVQAMRVASDEVSAAGNALLVQYFQDHPEMSALAGEPDVGDSWTRSYAVQQEIARRTAPVQDHFDTQFARRQELVSRYRYLSPALLAQEALNDLSGTGTARFRYFRASAERFHGEFSAFFVPRILQQTRLASTDYAAIPRFVFQEESERTVTARVLIAVLGILLPTGVIGAIALRRVRRYPITG